MKEDAVRKKNENAPSDPKKRVSKVKVALILGHTASHRGNITSEDFTHDWSFYVRGGEGCKIYSYIDRVIFKLHESFANPNQVITKPPFEIHEQGYGTFILEVEVKFRNKREPKSITYKYDLVLPAEGVAPIKRCRKEILTFTNPNTEFMTKLIDGGGVLHQYDGQGKIITDSVPSVPATVQKPLQPAPPNKNKEQPPKTHVDEEKMLTKDIKKEKRKEKKVKEIDDNTVEIKESKKQKKISKTSTSEVKVEKKPRAKEKQFSSFLTDFGDVESSDEERYFKDEAAQKAPAKLNEQSSSSTPKKVPGKFKPHKSKTKAVKEEQAFLEFDNLVEIKPKKKEKTKPEVISGIPSEADITPDKSVAHKIPKQKDPKISKKLKPNIPNISKDDKTSQNEESFLEFNNINSLNTSKKKSSEKVKNEEIKIKTEKKIELKKEIHEQKLITHQSKKRSNSLSSDTSEELKEDESLLSDPSEDIQDSRKQKPKEANTSKSLRTVSNSVEDKKTLQNIKCETFMEFDSVSSLKVVKKIPEKRNAPDIEKKSRPEEHKDKLEKSKALLLKKKDKKPNELVPRKRSSSLSSDTDGELEEEERVPTQVSRSPPISRVSGPFKMEQPLVCKEERTIVKSKPKEKKNKHKALKQELGDEDYLETKDSSHSFPAIASESMSETVTESLHNPLPEEIFSSNQHEYSINPLDTITAPVITESAPVSRRTHFSGPSSSDDNVVKQEPEESHELPNTIPLSPADHLRFMLNLYSKIHQLQKTDDISTITEVVNILASDSRSSINLKEDNVSFDLVNCDLETLRNIDNMLM